MKVLCFPRGFYTPWIRRGWCLEVREVLIIEGLKIPWMVWTTGLRLCIWAGAPSVQEKLDTWVHNPGTL